MSSTAQKTPLARSLEQFAARKIGGELELEGREIPASVVSVVSSGIVKVKLELTNIPFVLSQLTVPVMGSEYIRLPIQAGMMGWVMSADYYLGGMSGLGGGTADLTRRPNLSNLIFSPIGNKNWNPTDDPNSTVIYGPDGVILRDAGSKNKLAIASSGVTFTITNGQMTINMSDGQPFTINGNVDINGNAVVSGGVGVGGEITAPNGGTYQGAIQTAGAIVAGFGTGDQVNVQTHDHNYAKSTGATNPAATTSPNPGT